MMPLVYLESGMSELDLEGERRRWDFPPSYEESVANGVNATATVYIV